VRDSHNRSAIKHFRDINNHCQLVSTGSFLAARSAVPPPVVEYERWFVSVRGKTGKTSIDGRKLRRIVQMARNGCGASEIGASVGMAGGTVRGWLARLPAELAP
jgi:hypothetical protein